MTTVVGLFDLAEAVGRWVQWAVVHAINAVVAAIGGTLGLINEVFPDMPDVPEPPDGNEGILGVLAWVFPWGGLLAIMTAGVVIWVSFLTVKVIAKWVKVL